MDGFQRRREMKMKSILQAAFELFSTRGIKDVSIAEIAKKAEVSQVSIYNFFESKENLVRQIIFAFLSEKMNECEMLINSEITFQDKLEKLFLITTENDGKFSQEFIKSVMGSDPMIQNLLVEYYQNRTVPFILHLVEQGKKDGCIDNSISDEAILVYINTLKIAREQSGLSAKARQDLDSLFFYGLQGKPVL